MNGVIIRTSKGNNYELKRLKNQNKIVRIVRNHKICVMNSVFRYNVQVLLQNIKCRFKGTLLNNPANLIFFRGYTIYTFTEEYLSELFVSSIIQSSVLHYTNEMNWL